jgi:hypothetical protein
MPIKIVKHEEIKTEDITSTTQKSQNSNDDPNIHLCNCHCGGGEAKADQHSLVY